MFAQMFGQKSGIDIIAPASAIADNQGDLLALVKVRHRIGFHRSADKREQGEENSKRFGDETGFHTSPCGFCDFDLRWLNRDSHLV